MKINIFVYILYYLLTVFSLPVFAMNNETYSNTVNSHGGENGGFFEYFIVNISVIALIVVFVVTIRFLIWPGEKSKNHIKRQILEDKDVNAQKK